MHTHIFIYLSIYRVPGDVPQAQLGVRVVAIQYGLGSIYIYIHTYIYIYYESHRHNEQLTSLGLLVPRGN